MTVKVRSKQDFINWFVENAGKLKHVQTIKVTGDKLTIKIWKRT